jgi:hypothetical protein
MKEAFQKYVLFYDWVESLMMTTVLHKAKYMSSQIGERELHLS